MEKLRNIAFVELDMDKVIIKTEGLDNMIIECGNLGYDGLIKKNNR